MISRFGQGRGASERTKSKSRETKMTRRTCVRLAGSTAAAIFDDGKGSVRPTSRQNPPGPCEMYRLKVRG